MTRKPCREMTGHDPDAALRREELLLRWTVAGIVFVYAALFTAASVVCSR